MLRVLLYVILGYITLSHTMNRELFYLELLPQELIQELSLYTALNAIKDEIEKSQTQAQAIKKINKLKESNTFKHFFNEYAFQDAVINAIYQYLPYELEHGLMKKQSRETIAKKLHAKEWLIEQSKQKENQQKLIDALHKDNIIQVKELLDRGIDPNTSFLFESPLEIAIAKRNSNMVDLLLAYGANPNYHAWANTPLIEAIEHYFPTNPSKKLSKKECYDIPLHIINSLLKYGADPSIEILYLRTNSVGQYSLEKINALQVALKRLQSLDDKVSNQVKPTMQQDYVQHALSLVISWLKKIG